MGKKIPRLYDDGCGPNAHDPSVDWDDWEKEDTFFQSAKPVE